MSQVTRRAVVKILITVAMVAAGLFALTIPTQLVNAATTCDTVAGNTVPDCNNVCAVFKEACPDAIEITTAAGAAVTTTPRDRIVTTISNIANLLIGIAAAISVLYVVYGGWIILQGGKAGGVEKGREILYNAGIGVGVCILSFAIVRLFVQFLTGLN